MNAQTKTPVSTENTNERQTQNNDFKSEETLLMNSIITQIPEVVSSNVKPGNLQPIDIDTEYIPVLNSPTQPLTVQLMSTQRGYQQYLHPRARVTKHHDPTFTSPFAIIDHHQLEWRWMPHLTQRLNHVVRLNIFFSLKDLQFLFADDEVFRTTVLSGEVLSRVRRYRLAENRFKSCVPIKSRVHGNLQVKVTDGNQSRWANLCIHLNDICALMGGGGLVDYAKNVGIDMVHKSNLTSADKTDLTPVYESDYQKFSEYAKGDVVGLVDGSEVPLLETIFHLCTDNLNKIASLLGVTPCISGEFWGMSTGTAVARLISQAIAKRLGITTEQLSLMNKNATPVGLTRLAETVNKRSLVYAAMVDGGRAVSERYLAPGSLIMNTKEPEVYTLRKVKGVYQGVLCDIDISSCYANGLMNQMFCVGSPEIISESMSFADFERKVLKDCVPGCWSARISWKNAPFRQDLLVSKVPERMQSFDWAVAKEDDQGFEYDNDPDKVYEASMQLTTRSVHNACLTHDLYQILTTVCSKPQARKKADGNTEIEWLRKHAVIESVVYYSKKLRVTKVNTDMLKGNESKTGEGVLVGTSKQWVAFPMRELLGILIPERNRAKREFGKKSPQQTFLKLVNNTIYGCIASAFFGGESTGISNVVVGNNITARARSLAFLMAKGLGTFQSVTDGGVFDLNSVNYFRSMSLDKLSGLYTDDCYDSTRNKFCSHHPLLTRELTIAEVESKSWSSPLRGASDFNNVFDVSYLQDEIDSTAWKHLVHQFKGIDLLAENQFDFETKRLCMGFTPHNKVNYRMSQVIAGDNAGDSSYIAVRGMTKEKYTNEKGEEKSRVSQEANLLFDAYERNEPFSFCMLATKLLSLTDWRELKPELKSVLSPADLVSDNKTFYSLTPLHMRFETMSGYLATDIDYQKAKETGNHETVAEVGKLWVEESHKRAKGKLVNRKFTVHAS